MKQSVCRYNQERKITFSEMVDEALITFFLIIKLISETSFPVRFAPVVSSPQTQPYSLTCYYRTVRPDSACFTNLAVKMWV